jgi:hypothetical protein
MLTSSVLIVPKLLKVGKEQIVGKSSARFMTHNAPRDQTVFTKRMNGANLGQIHATIYILKV